MKTLRAKFALLLVGSIVALVTLITLAVMYVFALPKEAEADLLARQLIAMERLAGGQTGGVSAHPAAGETDPGQTELMRATAERLGTPLDLVVTHKPDDHRFRTISLKVAQDRWILIDVDPPSDPELWVWLALITVGVGAIAVFAADRIGRPLALLESAVESVRPDGVLPALAETGPAEVRATAAAINSLSARLKRVIESRMRLVAAAGHDLRTPLTRMRLRAEFISDEEERALWLKDIEELQRIADSAIQLVHEETTTTPPEVLRLDELVRSVAAELREHGLDVEVAEACEIHVRASRLTLSRALRNLFINAATHGGRGVVAVTGGETARITITDRGPGIPPDMLDQVFEPFFRTDLARSQNRPGSGLGLTISQEIVRKAGGTITLVNQPGGGLLQTVELPAIAPVPNA